MRILIALIAFIDSPFGSIDGNVKRDLELLNLITVALIPIDCEKFWTAALSTDWLHLADHLEEQKEHHGAPPRQGKVGIEHL